MYYEKHRAVIAAELRRLRENGFPAWTIPCAQLDGECNHDSCPSCPEYGNRAFLSGDGKSILLDVDGETVTVRV